MKLTGKILKSFLFLWAAAILWIYIGSLVNFHQHKIWGRPLLPQLLYAKRDKEHSIDFHKLIKPDLPRDINPCNFDHFIGTPASLSTEYFINSSSTNKILPVKFVLVKRLISSDGLRAPPLS
jgi:hypothetical protein